MNKQTPEKRPPATVKAQDAGARTGTGYPAAFKGPCDGRAKRVLGDIFNLSQFGVNLTTLAPGAWSAQRHWHAHEDEFVYVLDGEITLINDAGEHTMGPGQCAGFKAGEPDGHHLVNKSDAPASFLEIGTRSDIEHAEYPDIDMVADKNPETGFTFSHRNGDPW